MSNEFLSKVSAIVNALNTQAAALAAEGKRPLYRNFGFTMGPRHARIFAMQGGDTRSARAFVGVDGNIRRSDSWKKPGRVLGSHESPDAYAYILGPVFS